MRQNIFETRQRAKDLLQKAISIWRQSNKSDYLDGLESDPVFGLLITALAHLANEFDYEMEELKTEILEEFRSTMRIGESCKALPATAAVKVGLDPGVAELEIAPNSEFRLSGGEKESFCFLPLLKTRVIQTRVQSVVPMDGRRWKISLQFMDCVKNLKGLSFAFSDVSFHSLSVTALGREVPLIKPWEYANLPLSDYFSLSTLIYNQSQENTLSASLDDMASYMQSCALSLFARQDTMMFVVDDMEDFSPTFHLDLIMEFDGIADDFKLDISQFHLNVVLLANVQKSVAELSVGAPICRLRNDGGKQFLHLLEPGEDVREQAAGFTVRRIAADRFNPGRLQKLLYNLTNKYDTDFFAFQELGDTYTDQLIQELKKGLNELSKKAAEEMAPAQEGTYILLTGYPEGFRSQDVEYLVTDGSKVNGTLKDRPRFFAPAGFDDAQTRLLGEPQTGFDELTSKEDIHTASRYMITTKDRLVTETDIRLFCQKELSTRFGIVREMLDSIRTSRRIASQGSWHAYVIYVDIRLKDNIFIERALKEKLSGVELYLEKMITVRTTGLCPVKVSMLMNKSGQ